MIGSIPPNVPQDPIASLFYKVRKPAAAAVINAGQERDLLLVPDA